MNDPREFDELARQKLAERQFAFREGDWTDMQRMINDQGKKRRWPIWTLAAVLLVATPAVWGTLRDKPVAIAPVPPTQATAEVAAVEGSSPQASASPSMATEHAELVITELAIDAKAPAAAAAATAKEHVEQADAIATDAHVHRSKEAHSTRSTPDVRTGTAAAPTQIIASATTNASATSGSQGEMPADHNATSGTEDSASEGMIATGPVVSTSELAPGQDMSVTTPTSPATDAAIPANSSSASNVPAVPPSTTEVSISGDSSTTAITVQDSSLVPPPSAPTNWLAISGSHFEFSLLGGMSLSTSRYSATPAETWRTNSTGRWSSSFGIEAMRMKEHFGYGLGVHRARYAEQLRAEQISRTDDIYTTTFFLMPVQITTPVVIDTIQSGGVDYYVTTPTTVTVNQLMSNTDTTQQNTILREARTVLNRVDYWEVPLLVDLHTSTGRWCFGVRGGPSVGFLSVRKGAVPNVEGDGYSALGGSTYRSTMFGYQARMYARYRLSDRWSIGLEPVVRGHFSNAFAGNAPVRKNMSIGSLFSLIFRLP